MDIAVLGVKVDASGVPTSIDLLDDLADSGKKAEAAVESLGKKSAQASAQVKDMAGSTGKAASSTTNLGAAQQRAAAQSDQYAVSLGQQRAAMRQLPAQITDIITSLISGQPAYLVAIQQGGQLKDSFGGIVPAAQALLGAISPLTVGLGIAGAGLATLYYGLSQGQEESELLARSLIITGGAAGVSAGQVNLMADSIDRIIGTRAQAAEALGALAATGRIGGENLKGFAISALEAERNLGITTEKFAKDLADIAKAPVDASLKFNETMNYLNASTLRQIQTLKDAGRETEAVTVAQKAYSDAVQSRSAQVEDSIGNIAKSWRFVADETRKAKDALLDYGRAVPDDVRLAQLQQQRGTRPLGTVSGERGPRARQVVDDAEERQLQGRVDLLTAGAKLGKELADRQREGLAAQQDNLRISQGLLTNQERLNLAVATYNANLEKQRRGGVTVDPAKEAENLARLKASFADKSVADAALQTDDSIRDAVESLAVFNTRLRDQVATLGLSAEATLAYRLSVGDLSDAVASAGPLGDEYVKSITALSEKLRVAKEGQDALNRSVANQRSLAQDQADFNRVFADIGVGPKQRRYNAGKASVLQDPSRLNPAATDYQQQLADLEDYNAKALAQYNENFDKIEARAADFSLGFNDAIKAYVDSIRNVGSALGNDLVGAFAQAQVAGADFAAGAILWGEGGSEAAKQIARDLLTQTVSAFIQAGVKAAAFYAFQQAGEIALTGTKVGAETAQAAAAIAASSAITAASVAQAAIIAAAWAGPAAAVSLGSFGANAYPASAGLISTFSLSKSLSLGSGLLGFEDGGYTGDYGRQQVAGVVHGQEFVVNAAGTQRNRALLESINSGAPRIIPAPQVVAYQPGGSSQAPMQVFITNTVADRVSIRAEESRGPNGEQILQIVAESLADNTSPVSRGVQRRVGRNAAGSIG